MPEKLTARASLTTVARARFLPPRSRYRVKRPLLMMLVGFGLQLGALAHAAPVAKPEALELTVSLNDKKVGIETLRTQSGQEGRYDSLDASLQDKVNKAWKSFQQRATLDSQADGTIKSYRRGIYVTGATINTNLFSYNGGWRIGAQADAGGKPKVTDVKLKAPFVVLDERSVALVVLAAERLQKLGDADYVRVDNATSGHLTLTTETLAAEGKHWTRLHLKDGKNVNLEVLKAPGGQVVAVKGLEGWTGVTTGQKVPANLTPVAKDAKPAELPAGATPTHHIKPVVP